MVVLLARVDLTMTWFAYPVRKGSAYDERLVSRSPASHESLMYSSKAPCESSRMTALRLKWVFR